MDKVHTVFFIGKPGCGKGTQAKFLAEHTGWPIFGSGKLFRDLAAEDSAVGHKLKEENDAGLLQPHWFAMYLYLKSLFSVPEGQSVIFDGFNRKVEEAQLVIESLIWLGRPFSMVNLQVSDETVIHRLEARGKDSGRADDKVIGERIKEYYLHTDKALEVFREAGVLIDINGEQETENIAADVRKALAVA